MLKKEGAVLNFTVTLLIATLRNHGSKVFVKLFKITVFHHIIAIGLTHLYFIILILHQRQLSNTWFLSNIGTIKRKASHSGYIPLFTKIFGIKPGTVVWWNMVRWSFALSGYVWRCVECPRCVFVFLLSKICSVPQCNWGQLELQERFQSVSMEIPSGDLWGWEPETSTPGSSRVMESDTRVLEVHVSTVENVSFKY